MDMLDWAKREVDIACKRERGDKPEDEWDYGCACYQSALEAFEVLCNQDHSGMSMAFTKAMLNALIEGRPLTSIEDTEDVWNLVSDSSEDDYKMYQCSRMRSLFKYVYSDGSVKYKDVDRMFCVSVENPTVTYHSGLVSRVAEGILPSITMPYFPNGKAYKFYCEDFLTDRKNGDFDTVGIYYYQDLNGELKNVYRYFKEADNDFGWEEISLEEYEERRKLAEAREREEAKNN